MTPETANRQLADTLLRQQKFDEAARAISSSSPADELSVSALMQLGIAYMALGRQDDAIVQFRRV